MRPFDEVRGQLEQRISFERAEAIGLDRVEQIRPHIKGCHPEAAEQPLVGAGGEEVEARDDITTLTLLS